MGYIGGQGMLRDVPARILRGARRNWLPVLVLTAIWVADVVLVSFGMEPGGGEITMAYFHLAVSLPVVLWFCWLNGKRNGD